eukprot:TRINITY_DN161_c0_g1_i2.p1 TRINITY_DN161_c0_g1~~TRINITY_DN161_c0_g1_i2.p1  ORF type:complete len:547 (+),score=86.15 TRINITY_DN161_c0_g1_i2:41-1681(+)
MTMHTAIVAVLATLLLVGIHAQQFDLEYGTYLFHDSTLVQSMKGASFEQHRPIKQGKIIVRDFDWETVIFFYTSAIQAGPGDYRLYYTCWGPANAEKTENLCVAQSKDGITWTKPKLGLIPYDGNYETNIVWTFDWTGWPNTVNIDQNPDAHPDQRFVMTYDKADRFLRVASSPDGYKWQTLESPLIASQFADTQTVPIWDHRLEKYVVFGRVDNNFNRHDECTGNYNSYRSIERTATLNSSIDSFVNKTTTVMLWDKLDPVCVDIYNSAAVLYPADPLMPSYLPKNVAGQKTTPSVYIVFPSYTFHMQNGTTPINPYTLNFGHNDNLLDIHLAFSSSGFNFSYVTKEPFIPRGIGIRNMTDGTFNSVGSDWDAGFVFMSRGMFEDVYSPNYINLYYFGTQKTHSSAGDYQNLSAMGRASIRRDGFVSLTTDYNLPMPQAAIVTRPLVLPSASLCSGKQELHVNIETSIAGYVSVEILSASGLPIPGYTRGEFISIKGNFIRVPLMWNVGGAYNTDVKKLANNQTIQLSFEMSHTKLYALEVACVL